MKTLIVGSTGFIGSNLHAAIGGDVLNRKEIEEGIWPEQEYDVVYNCAGCSNPSESDPLILAVNISLVELLVVNVKCKTFVHLSSGLVYDKGKREGDFITPKILSQYGLSKWMGERVTLFHPNPKIVRLGTIVGPNMRHGLIPDLIRKHQEDDVVRLRGSYPGSTRQYLHVSDLIEYLIKIPNLKDIIYNVSNEHSLSVNAVNYLVQEHLQSNKQCVFDSSDNNHLDLNCAKLYKETHYPKLAVFQAVKRAIHENCSSN